MGVMNEDRLAFYDGLIKTHITNTTVAKETGKGLSTNDYTTDEKTKLAGIADGANKTIVDSALDTSSENPVQNKVVKGAVDELKQDLGVERARIDSFTKLPEGSTTGDAELQDIRVKADGTTATSAGNAVREQVAELKSDLDDLGDNIIKNANSVSYKNYGEILERTNAQKTTSGTLNIVTNVEGYYVIKVKVRKNERYRIKCFSNNDVLYGAGFYCVDESNSIIYAYNKKAFPSENKYREEVIEFVPPTNTKFIYVNGYVDDTIYRPCKVERVVYKTIDDRLLEYEENVLQYSLLNYNLYTNNCYQTVSSDNTVRYGGGGEEYKCIEYTLNGESKLRAYCGYSNDTNYGVGYYCVDSNEKIITSYNAEYGSGYVEFDVPPNTHKVYVNNNGLGFVPTLEKVEIINGFTPKFYTKNESDNLYSKKSLFSMSIFKKIAVIGDSYSSGCVYNRVDGSGGDDNYELSWIQNIARRIGATAENFSQCGFTTGGWIEGANGLAKMNNAEPQDLYIISLGINDVYRACPDNSAYYTVSESDVINKTRGSMCGNLSIIIDAVLTKSRNAKIVLLQQCNLYISNSTFKYYFQKINECIQYVADYNGLPCLSLNENDYFKSNYYRDNVVEGHPNAVSYVGMSVAIQSMIEDILDTDYFNNYPY